MHHENNVEAIACVHAHGFDVIVVADYFDAVGIRNSKEPLKAGSAEAGKHNREGGTEGKLFYFSVHGV